MKVDLKVSGEYRDSVLKYSEEQLTASSTSIEIPWEPAATEVILSHPNTRFVVFVPNVKVMASVAGQLSQNLKFDTMTLQTGRMVFSGKDSQKKWMVFAKGLGPVAAGGLLLRLTAKAIAMGSKVGGLAVVMDDVLLQGVRPMDADIIGLAHNVRSRR